MKHILPAPLLSVFLFGVWLLLNHSLSAGHMVLGAILGFMLCGAVLVVIFLSDRSFKDADAMQKYFGMMPLAVVPSVQLDNKAKRTHRTAKEDAE